jgi:hypothetical protein
LFGLVILKTEDSHLMSDYDSVSHYAAALEVSERQIRRYCQAGLIPSAELTKGRTGRPKWLIKDTSPQAINAVQRNLAFHRSELATFWEPRRIQPCEQKPDEQVVSTKISLTWVPFRAAIPDRYSLITILAHRAALRLRRLTEYDITNPPVYRDGPLYVTYPAHEEKIRKFERTEFRLLYGLCKPKTSKQYRWAHRVLTRDLRENDIMQAAERLAIFHQTHGIEITYRSLARVLGMSKSSMYRTYRGLVGEALKLTHKKAASPTQGDEWAKEDYLRDSNSFSTKARHDLGFADLYNAVLELNTAGKPMDERNIYLALRGKGGLAKGEKLSDHFSPTDVENAVRAVTEPQLPRSSSTRSRCSAA